MSAMSDSAEAPIRRTGRGAFPTFRRAIGNLGWPILLKQLRAAFRRNRFFVAHFLCVSALGVYVLFHLALVDSEAVRPTPTQVGRSIFNIFLELQVLVVFLVFPLCSTTAFTEERSRQSLDMLLITSLTAREIVWGKFFAATIYCFLFLAATIPLLSISFLYGGVLVRDVALTYLFLFGATMVVSMLGLAVSSCCRSNIVATLAVYLYIFAAAMFLWFWEFDSGITEALRGESERNVVRAFIDSLSSKGRATELVLAKYALDAVALFCTLFIFTCNRIRPRAENSSTSLRVLALLYLPLRAFLSFVGDFHQGAFSPDFEVGAAQVGSSIRGALIWASVLLVIAAMSFPTEDSRISRKVRTEVSRWRGFLGYQRLLAPGPWSGLLFTALLATLVSAVLLLAFELGPGRFATTRTSHLVYQVTATLPLWITFLSSIGFVLSAANFTPLYARLTSIFLFIIQLLLPTIFYVADKADRVWHFYYLSPIVIWKSLQARSPGDTGVVHELWGQPTIAIARIVFVAGAVLLCAVGWWLLRRAGQPLLDYSLPVETQPARRPAAQRSDRSEAALSG